MSSLKAHVTIVLIPSTINEKPWLLHKTLIRADAIKIILVKISYCLSCCLRCENLTLIFRQSHLLKICLIFAFRFWIPLTDRTVE